MVGADFLKARAHHAVREFGAVAFSAQVAEIKTAQTGGHDRLGGIRGVFVGEMSMSAEDALFEAPRPADGVLQHFDIVVAFKDENVGGANAFDDQFGDVSQVGGEANVAAAGVQEKSNGILGVMRDGESVHCNVADFETAAGREEAAFKLGVVLAFNCLVSGTITVKRDAQFVGEAGQTLDVIRMFVGDQDAVQTFWRATDARQTLADLPHTETRINENAGFVGFQIGAVAAGTAAQNRKINSHDATLVMVTRGGNVFPFEGVILA